MNVLQIYYRDINDLIKIGHSIAQADKSRLLTKKTRVQSQVTSRKICCGRSDNEAGLSPEFFVASLLIIVISFLHTNVSESQMCASALTKCSIIATEVVGYVLHL
jgi:hypothetical protein